MRSLINKMGFAGTLLMVLVALLAVFALASRSQACNGVPVQAQFAPACAPCGQVLQQQVQFAPVYQQAVQFAPVAAYGAAFAVPQQAFIQSGYGVQASFGTVGYGTVNRAVVVRAPGVAVDVGRAQVAVGVGRQHRRFFLPGRQRAANQVLSETLGVPARAVR